MRRGIGRLRAGGGFDPRTLFPVGRKGIWRDPSDVTTLFQDTSGLVPVTATGQSVQYIRDKSGNGYHGVVVGATWEVDASGRNYLNFSGAAAGISPASIAGWSTDMYSAAVLQPASTASHIAYSEANGAAQKFYGLSASGSASLTYGTSALVSDTHVNGSSLIPNDRGTLNTALGTTSPKLEESIGANLSSWSNFLFGKYTGLLYAGRFYGDIAVDAVTTQEINSIRSFMSGKGGVSGIATATEDGAGVGDSTVAAYLGTTAVIDFVNTSKKRVYIASPGHTIAMQQAAWTSVGYHGLAKWVVIQIGLNDLDTTSDTAAQAIARLQALVTQVRNDVRSSAKVLISQMIPCKQRLINEYGAVNGAASYQKWLDMNDAMAGNGATPITGVDARITAHVALLSDGAGNLAAAYDTGDGLHPNNAGRQIVATAWANALTSLGVL